jgi:hypothetical protein
VGFKPILLKYLHGTFALPGWTGYINHRTTYHSEWQQEYPITLEDYHLVRLWVAKIDAEIYPEDNDTSISSLSKLQYIWLKAWEKLAKELVKVLDSKQISTSTTEKKERVQMLKWCFIDTDQS